MTLTQNQKDYEPCFKL